MERQPQIGAKVYLLTWDGRLQTHMVEEHVWEPSEELAEAWAAGAAFLGKAEAEKVCAICNHSVRAGKKRAV